MSANEEKKEPTNGHNCPWCDSFVQKGDKYCFMCSREQIRPAHDEVPQPLPEQEKSLEQVYQLEKWSPHNDVLRPFQKHEAGLQAVADEAVRRNDSKWWKLYCDVKAKQMLSDSKQSEQIAELREALRKVRTLAEAHYDYSYCPVLFKIQRQLLSATTVLAKSGGGE